MGLAQHMEIGFRMHYKKSVLNELIHKKQFNEFDFLSFVGGFLGLFAGFSALSFIELIYWFTIRVFLVNLNRLRAKVHPISQSIQNTSKWLKIKDFFMSYFSESSIHGLSQVFELSLIGR